MAPDSVDDPRLTVMFCIGTLTVGGAEQVLIDTALGLDPAKFRVLVCSLGGEAEFDVKLRGTPVRQIWLRKRPGLDWRLLPRLVRLLREERVDVLHTHLFTANAWGRLAGVFANTPRVWSTEHSVDRWKNPLRRWIDWLLANAGSGIVAVSESVKRFYVNEIGIPASRIRVIYNGIDPERLRAGAARTRLELGIPDAALVVGTVGRMTAAKDYPTWLAAFHRIVQHAAVPVHGLIIGGGELQDAVREDVARWGLSERITLTGHQEEIAGFYPLMDLFLMSSTREGFPIVLLEAMACGVPVVATQVGGVGEILTDDAVGLLAQPGDAAALAAAACALLDDAPRRRRIAEAGRMWVTKRFHLRDMLERHAALYEQPSVL